MLVQISFEIEDFTIMHYIFKIQRIFFCMASSMAKAGFHTVSSLVMRQLISTTGLSDDDFEGRYAKFNFIGKMTSEHIPCGII